MIVGDNGTITSGASRIGRPTVTCSIRRDTVQLRPRLHPGQPGNDDVYAGGDGDLVHGDEGDDYVEGNGGSTGRHLGGDRWLRSACTATRSGRPDRRHLPGLRPCRRATTSGAAWATTCAGDNARSAGPGTCKAVCNTSGGDVGQDVVIRKIVLWDVATTTPRPMRHASGDDTIGGQDGHDRRHGQGGGDNIKGGANDDFAFGNAGADTILGGDGQDDLVGGTGRTNSTVAGTAEDGRLDEGDLI